MLEWAERPSSEARRAALSLATSAATADPDNPALQLALGRTLEITGEVERAAETFRAALARFPGSEPLTKALASALGRLGEIDEALSLAKRVADRGWADCLALSLLVQSGRFEEAASFEAAVAAADPFDPALVELRLRRLRREPQAMLRLCDGLLAERPGYTPALHHKAIALAQVGHGEAAAALMGIDNFVRDTWLAPIEGFTDEPQFLAALEAEIASARDLRRDPAGYATVAGFRTRRFPGSGDRASAALVGALRAAAGDYSAALRGDHPFVRARPKRASLTAWGLVFGEAGRQRIHYHSEAWLTGVYYVAAPEIEGDGGSIRIGIMPGWAGIDPPWPVLTIKPQPGRLLIFPSFVPHDTVPTGAAGKRIAVAFDVRPAQ